MTPTQKKVMLVLFAGGTIAKVGNAYRLRDSKVNVVLKFYYNTLFAIREYITSHKGVYQLSKSKVRAQRKNKWVKREYLKYVKQLHETAGDK